MTRLIRRGHHLGHITIASNQDADSLPTAKQAWASGNPSILRSICADAVAQNVAHIRQSKALLEAILDQAECDTLLDQAPYQARLADTFENLGSAFNEGDDQEIEMVLFDAVQGDTSLAEDLWMKVSWLSFDDEDASLRFRFSFGVDLEEDVAADPTRQKYAATLADAVFPESTIITTNEPLIDTLRQSLDAEDIHFVERIVYFNAPNGGAYLHHDLERGHAGVVYAQLTGQTFWLALPRSALIREIISFAAHSPLPDSLTRAMREEIQQLIKAPQQLAQELETFANSSLIHLINETEAFVQHLITAGYGHQVNAGDVMLLPQTDVDTCCWHSVFCLGDEIGEALSFAIRTNHDTD